ncbi:MAG: GNAT family N-acetyltransferase [Myxococcales bacterium]|nr:GNAT family N-acetyltransferase [Myxococcales bacterium]
MTELPIVCPRVTLRRLEPNDLRAFQAYRHDPEVGRYQGWEPESDDAATAFLTECQTATLLARGRWCQVGIGLNPDARLIGDIGIYLAQDGAHAELGFSLARAHQGQGLATEAVQAALTWVFTATQVHRVVGVTDARNGASARLLARLGMRLEKTMQAKFRGQMCTEHQYAVLRAQAALPQL